MNPLFHKVDVFTVIEHQKQGLKDAFQSVTAFVVNPVDTTAAGDAFNGAFAVALLRGQSARESAMYASAVAAISVTRAGAQPSMPAAKEVEDFMQERAALTR